MPAIEPIPAQSDDLDLVAEAAREAGRIAMRYFRRSPEVWWKEGNSPVTEGDFAVDRYLRETLLAARPDYGWLSEETADSPDRLSARRTFVVDPIDGTRAFMAGRSTWCVSVAVVEEGRPVVGVLECPVKEQTFLAVRDGGATMNGRTLAVREIEDMPTIGGPKTMIRLLPAELREHHHTHAYVPSLAYRIAMVAQGVLDASFVKPDSHDWDLAAADLILAEAGGRIIDDKGEEPLYATLVARHGPLAAGSGPLLDAMAKVVAAYAHQTGRRPV